MNKLFHRTPIIDTNEAVNVVDSITKAKGLYKELCKICHPDLYINHPQHDMAEQLFQELQGVKYDYHKLLAIKEKITMLRQEHE